MEKPTPSTLLVLGVLAFPTVAFPALFVPVLAAWIGWKIYRRRVPHHSREIRQSIREREARQGQRYAFSIQDETPRLDPASVEYYHHYLRQRRRVPRDRP